MVVGHPLTLLNLALWVLEGNGLLGELEPFSLVSALTVFGGVLSGLIGRIFKRLPSTALELLLGVVFGGATGWHPSNLLTVLAAGVGLFLLMANSGYEAGEEVLANHLRIGVKLAVVGAICALALTFTSSEIFGFGNKVSLLLGIAAAPTSVGIATRSFYQLGLLKTKIASLVLSVAVIDDLVGIALLLAGEVFIVSADGRGSIKILLASLLPPTVLLILIKLFPSAKGADPVFKGALVGGMILISAVAMVASGSIVVVGFAFGTALAIFGVSAQWSAVKALWKGTEYLSPLFFFLAGDSATVTHPGMSTFLSFLAVVVGVIISRLIVVYVGQRVLSDWIIFAASLLPRGEVTLVVLLAGVTAGIVNQPTYLGGVGAVLVTSIVSPVVLSARQSSFHEEGS